MAAGDERSRDKMKADIAEASPDTQLLFDFGSQRPQLLKSVVPIPQQLVDVVTATTDHAGTVSWVALAGRLVGLGRVDCASLANAHQPIDKGQRHVFRLIAATPSIDWAGRVWIDLSGSNPALHADAGQRVDAATAIPRYVPDLVHLDTTRWHHLGTQTIEELEEFQSLLSSDLFDTTAGVAAKIQGSKKHTKILLKGPGVPPYFRWHMQAGDCVGFRGTLGSMRVIDAQMYPGATLVKLFVDHELTHGLGVGDNGVSCLVHLRESNRKRPQQGVPIGQILEHCAPPPAEGSTEPPTP